MFFELRPYSIGLQVLIDLNVEVFILKRIKHFYWVFKISLRYVEDNLFKISLLILEGSFKIYFTYKFFYQSHTPNLQASQS